MEIQGKLIDIKRLSNQQKERMLCLMKAYFVNIERDTFYSDLHEKQGAIILWDKHTKVIQGFSTLMLIDYEVDQIPIRLVFSGDTIIAKSHWGSTALPKVFGNFMLNLIDARIERKLFWILISKGYKTYRFLPVYFNDFYPRYNQPTPIFEKKIMDTFGKIKYPDSYLKEKGIIRLKGDKPHLKKNLAEINSRLLRDRHISFFQENNPGHAIGDELVCVAELSLKNLKHAANKLLLQNQVVITKTIPSPDIL